MQIYGPTHLHGASPIGGPHGARMTKPASPAASPSSIQDEVQISDAGRMIDRVREMPEIRQDRVNQIRAQIANGTYETPEKLQIALERLLGEIG